MGNTGPMVPRRRPFAVLALAPVAAAVALALPIVVAGPAEARTTPWAGHPDRQLVTHVVRPGDTATGLATRFHAWTRELVALNHLDRAGTLRVGERIRIPVVVSAARRGRTSTPATAPAHQSAHQSATPSARGWRHWRMSRPEVRRAIALQAVRHGVPVRLAQAVGWQESGWYQPVRS